MNLLKFKTSALFAITLVLAMSCADDEKVTPHSLSNSDEHTEVTLDPDLDFVAPNYSEEAARIPAEQSIHIKSFSFYLARTSNVTAGSLKFKIFDESTQPETSLMIASFNVSQLAVWNGDLSSPNYSVITLPLPAAVRQDSEKTYRAEVQCINCSTDASKQVVWWSANASEYPLGTGKHKTGDTWTSHNNDFAFKIINVNSDGTDYVSRAQAKKERVYKLNTGDIQAQTYKPELGDDYIISIPDANLASAVRQKSGLNSSEPITYGDALSITSLEASNISNLEGIQYLKNLQTFTLIAQGNLDLIPLRDLSKLSTLFLHGTEVTNIAPISALTNLTSLLISNNVITNIAPLSPLTKLTELTLFANKLTGVGAIGLLTKLTKLRLESNELVNVSSFSALGNLQTLELRTRKLTNIQSFVGLTKLTYLKLFSNNSNGEIVDDYVSDLANIGSLATLTKLTYLEIVDTKVSNLGALAGLTNLTDLRLSENQITNIAPLAGLTNLQYLNLAENQIQTIPPMASLTQLSSLTLSNNQLINLINLNHITSLDYLYLSGNASITQQMVNTLQQQLPNTEIYFYQ